MSELLTDEDVRERPYLGEHFSAGVVHGLRVTVTPAGWRVASRGRLVASGAERGAAGWAKAREVVEGTK